MTDSFVSARIQRRPISRDGELYLCWFDWFRSRDERMTRARHRHNAMWTASSYYCSKFETNPFPRPSSCSSIPGRI
jgi:hypothetical protein